jgi:hypothetical protein
MDIEEKVIGYQDPEVKEYWESRSGQPYGEEEPELTPPMIYSLGLKADELLTTYAGLRTYLKVLASQESEDLEQIQRITKLLISLRPRAVRASKEIALAAVGIDSSSK